MIILIGGGGHALEIFDLIEREHQSINLSYFYEEKYFSRSAGLAITTKLPRLEKINDKKLKDLVCLLGVGSPELRMRFMNEFSRSHHLNLISTRAEISEQAKFERENGLTIMNGTYVGPGVQIGKGVLIHKNAQVYHGSVIQDFTVLSPNSKILGEVNLGSKTLVGASAMILPRVEVGNHVIIGANSLVTKNIKDHSVVYGQPARFIKRVECESC